MTINQSIKYWILFFYFFKWQNSIFMPAFEVENLLNAFIAVEKVVRNVHFV